jgi:hypothetical protein
LCTLFALTAAQASGGSAGPVLLGRLASALFELDRWVPQHQDDLRDAARDRAVGQVEVPGLPVVVSIPLTVASEGDPAQVEAAIASAAGERLWREGRSAFAGDDGPGGDISLTSPVRWTISLLKQDRHAPWLIAAAAGMVTALALALLTLFTSIGGFAGVSRGLLVAGLLYGAACGAGWLAMQGLARAASSPLDIEIARIVRDCAWIGLRAGFATALIGLAALVAAWTGQRDRRYQEWPSALDEPA